MLDLGSSRGLRAGSDRGVIHLCDNIPVGDNSVSATTLVVMLVVGRGGGKAGQTSDECEVLHVDCGLWYVYFSLSD